MQTHKVKDRDYLSPYFVNWKCSNVTAEDITRHLKIATGILNYHMRNGIPVNQGLTHIHFEGEGKCSCTVRVFQYANSEDEMAVGGNIQRVYLGGAGKLFGRDVIDNTQYWQWTTTLNLARLPWHKQGPSKSVLLSTMVQRQWRYCGMTPIIERLRWANASRTGTYLLFVSLERDYITSGFLCLLLVGVTTPCFGAGWVWSYSYCTGHLGAMSRECGEV
jgi:hypothetical protein